LFVGDIAEVLDIMLIGGTAALEATPE